MDLGGGLHDVFIVMMSKDQEDPYTQVWIRGKTMAGSVKHALGPAKPISNCILVRCVYTKPKLPSLDPGLNSNFQPKLGIVGASQFLSIGLTHFPFEIYITGCWVRGLLSDLFFLLC